MHETIHWLLESINASALLLIVWKGGKFVGEVSRALTNDLPHMAGDVKELRTAFIDHLQNGCNSKVR